MRQQSTRVRAGGSTLLCPWAVGLILSVLAAIPAGATPMGEEPPADTIDLGEIGAGDLLCRTDRGYVPLPMLDLDVTLVQLQKKQCSNCGRPASMAIRALETQERQFLCGGCRPRPFK